MFYFSLPNNQNVVNNELHKIVKIGDKYISLKKMVTFIHMYKCMYVCKFTIINIYTYCILFIYYLFHIM